MWNKITDPNLMQVKMDSNLIQITLSNDLFIDEVNFMGYIQLADTLLVLQPSSSSYWSYSISFEDFHNRAADNSTSPHAASSSALTAQDKKLIIALAVSGGSLLIIISIVICVLRYHSRAQQFQLAAKNVQNPNTDIALLNVENDRNSGTDRESQEEDKVSMSTLVPRSTPTNTLRKQGPQRTSSAIRNIRRKDEKDMEYDSSDEEKKSDGKEEITTTKD